MNQQVTFADAVAHFQRIGFTVTPGPRIGEVTLSLDQGDAISTTVWPQEMLPPIAQVSQAYRFQNALLRLAPARLS
jgi:hypothetical protein